MRHLYSTVGLILGFVAVCLAAFETSSAPGEPQSKNDRAVWQINLSKHSLSLKSNQDEPTAQPTSVVRTIYTALGLLAIGLGVFAWTRKEHRRIAGGALALGLVAVAWQWVLIGVCIAVALFVLTCVFT